MENKIKKLKRELESSETARSNLKINIQEITNTKIELEEELFSAKNSLLDLID